MSGPIPFPDFDPVALEIGRYKQYIKVPRRFNGRGCRAAVLRVLNIGGFGMSDFDKSERAAARERAAAFLASNPDVANVDLLVTDANGIVRGKRVRLLGGLGLQ